MIDVRESYMSGAAWAAYDAVTEGGLGTVAKPLPGWRVDRLYADGRIGDYSDAGTRQARCQRRAFVDAVSHDPKCECGYRLVRDVYTVLQFANIQPPNGGDVAVGQGRGSDLGFVLTRTVGTGRLAGPAHDDPPGTVRAAETSLIEVWLPRYVGTTPDEVKALARKIRKMYGVTVHVMPGEGLYSFPGSPDTVAPKGWPACAVQSQWHESGNWGLHGAAGAMLSTVMDGEQYFLLVQRSRVTSYGQPGLWQLPGGALDEGETPLEAATRETLEELGIPELGGGSVVGEVVYEHRTGWQYTNYAVTVVADPGVVLDKTELQDALWFDRAGLLDLADAGELVPAFAEKLPELLDCFGLPQRWSPLPPSRGADHLPPDTTAAT